MNLGRLFPLPMVALALASTAVYACSATGDGSYFGDGGAGGTASNGVGFGGSMANSSGDGLFDGGPGASAGSGGPGGVRLFVSSGRPTGPASRDVAARAPVR